MVIGFPNFILSLYGQPVESPGSVMFVTEQNGFLSSTQVGTFSYTPSHITVCTHEASLPRIFVGWIDGETAKYAYSDTNGATWSSTIILGTYTGLDFLSLPTGHLLAVVEHHHRLWGMVSRDRGITWDDLHPIWHPEAAIEPYLLLDSYNDVLVFTSELDTSTPLEHGYKIQLRDLPFYAFGSDTIDWGGVSFTSSSSRSVSSSSHSSSSASSFSSSSASSFSSSSASSFSSSSASSFSSSSASSFSSSSASSFSSSSASSFSSSSSSSYYSS